MACENKRANPLTDMQAQAKNKAEDMTKLEDAFKELNFEVQEGNAKIVILEESSRAAEEAKTKDAATIKAQAKEIAKLTDDNAKLSEEYTKLKMEAGKNKHALGVKISTLKANKHALGVKIKTVQMCLWDRFTDFETEASANAHLRDENTDLEHKYLDSELEIIEFDNGDHESLSK